MELESDLDAVRDFWQGVDQVKDLPRFHYIAYDRETKATMQACIP